MSNGSIGHRPKPEGGIGSDNELVNPGESRWKWNQWRIMQLKPGADHGWIDDILTH